MEHALFSSEQMTLAEALSMYTIEAAFAARAEEPTAGEYFCVEEMYVQREESM